MISLLAAIAIVSGPYPAGPDQPTGCDIWIPQFELDCVIKTLALNPPDTGVSVITWSDASLLPDGTYPVLLFISFNSPPITTGTGVPGGTMIDSAPGARANPPVFVTVTHTGVAPAVPVIRIEP